MPRVRREGGGGGGPSFASRRVGPQRDSIDDDLDDDDDDERPQPMPRPFRGRGFRGRGGASFRPTPTRDDDDNDDDDDERPPPMPRPIRGRGFRGRGGAVFRPAIPDDSGSNSGPSTMPIRGFPGGGFPGGRGFPGRGGVGRPSPGYDDNDNDPPPAFGVLPVRGRGGGQMIRPQPINDDDNTPSQKHRPRPHHGSNRGRGWSGGNWGRGGFGKPSPGQNNEGSQGQNNPGSHGQNNPGSHGQNNPGSHGQNNPNLPYKPGFGGSGPTTKPGQGGGYYPPGQGGGQYLPGQGYDQDYGSSHGSNQRPHKRPHIRPGRDENYEEGYEEDGYEEGGRGGAGYNRVDQGGGGGGGSGTMCGVNKCCCITIIVLVLVIVLVVICLSAFCTFTSYCKPQTSATNGTTGGVKSCVCNGAPEDDCNNERQQCSNNKPSQPNICYATAYYKDDNSNPTGQTPLNIELYCAPSRKGPYKDYDCAIFGATKEKYIIHECYCRTSNCNNVDRCDCPGSSTNYGKLVQYASYEKFDDCRPYDNKPGC